MYIIWNAFFIKNILNKHICLRSKSVISRIEQIRTLLHRKPVRVVYELILRILTKIVHLAVLGVLESAQRPQTQCADVCILQGRERERERESERECEQNEKTTYE
jgi:hypothetical protein